MLRVFPAAPSLAIGSGCSPIAHLADAYIPRVSRPVALDALRIARQVGPRFHVMPGQDSTLGRAAFVGDRIARYRDRHPDNPMPTDEKDQPWVMRKRRSSAGTRVSKSRSSRWMRPVSECFTDTGDTWHVVSSDTLS